LLVTTGVIFSYWSNLAKGKGKWQRRKAPAAMMRLKTRRSAAVQISTLLDERRQKGIDHAIHALYPYTQFHDVCHDMYMKVVGGDLTLEEEEVLRKLGLKF
jgi:hypothetical protein